MFCPNCKGELQAVDTEELLSQDLWGGDYYTHQCLGCGTYWHLHISDSNCVLIATNSDQIASKKIKTDLVKELRKRADNLDARE